MCSLEDQSPLVLIEGMHAFSGIRRSDQVEYCLLHYVCLFGSETVNGVFFLVLCSTTLTTIPTSKISPVLL
jgi:hypothetical protein